eukprot:6186986-Pleurochrysis_carterae.AAC.2
MCFFLTHGEGQVVVPFLSSERCFAFVKVSPSLCTLSDALLAPVAILAFDYCARRISRLTDSAASLLSQSFAVHAVAPNGQEIVIEDAAEEDPIEFFVARVCAVADLRCDDHCLTFNGVSLEKGHTLKSYGITKSEKLEIRPRLAGVTTPSRGSQGSPRFGSVGSVGSHNSLSALMSPMPVGAAPLHTSDELIDFGI